MAIIMLYRQVPWYSSTTTIRAELLYRLKDAET